MSGHSHWAGIKHKKGVADARRSKMFSKLANEITLAAREGTDPEANPRLRTVIEKARKENMPADNIERAIKRASADDSKQLEEVLFEAYGPGGIAILVQTITDNKNRTMGEIKQIITKHQGKLVEGGAIQWMFDRRGVVTVLAQQTNVPKEDLELLVIEAGAQDVYWQGAERLDVYVAPSDLGDTKKALEATKLPLEAATLDWVPKEHIALSEKDQVVADRLFEALDENDAVQDIYSNLKT